MPPALPSPWIAAATSMSPAMTPTRGRRHRNPSPSNTLARHRATPLRLHRHFTGARLPRRELRHPGRVQDLLNWLDLGSVHGRHQRPHAIRRHQRPRLHRPLLLHHPAVECSRRRKSADEDQGAPIPKDPPSHDGGPTGQRSPKVGTPRRGVRRQLGEPSHPPRILCLKNSVSMNQRNRLCRSM